VHQTGFTRQAFHQTGSTSQASPSHRLHQTGCTRQAFYQTGFTITQAFHQTGSTRTQAAPDRLNTDRLQKIKIKEENSLASSPTSVLERIFIFLPPCGREFTQKG
jgi:hypothetical protein